MSCEPIDLVQTLTDDRQVRHTSRPSTDGIMGRTENLLVSPESLTMGQIWPGWRTRASRGANSCIQRISSTVQHVVTKFMWFKRDFDFK